VIHVDQGATTSLFHLGSLDAKLLPFPIVGSRDMHRYDSMSVRSRRPGFKIITLATLSLGGKPVLINSLINLQRPVVENE
jgi:hypothetical protein